VVALFLLALSALLLVVLLADRVEEGAELRVVRGEGEAVEGGALGGGVVLGDVEPRSVVVEVLGGLRRDGRGEQEERDGDESGHHWAACSISTTARRRPMNSAKARTVESAARPSCIVSKASP